LLVVRERKDGTGGVDIGGVNRLDAEGARGTPAAVETDEATLLRQTAVIMELEGKPLGKSSFHIFSFRGQGTIQ
jgi:hypothetical protein